MDWKDLGSKIAGLGLPLLGAALPIPGGAAIGKALAETLGVSTPEEVAKKVDEDPEALKVASEFQMAHREKMQALQNEAAKDEMQAELEELRTVNQTMQVELQNSANEAWYQKAWRPANGFCVALGSFISVVFSCYLFYLAIVNKDLNALNALPQLATAIALILGVPGAAVGIASWHRGKAQREALGK